MDKKLKERIADNDVPSLIFLFGEEEFLIEETARDIISNLIKDESDKFNYDVFDGDETDQSRIAEIASSFPMMSEKRVILLKRIKGLFSGRGSKKDLSSELGRYFKDPASSTTMVITGAPESIKGFNKVKHDPSKLAAKIKSVQFPYDVILQNSYWIEYPKIYESEMPSWVQQRVKHKGMDILPDAVDLLLAFTNPSLREIDNEIDKLKLYMGDTTHAITIKDVNSLSGAAREFTVFELTKAVGKRDIRSSMEILIKMQESSDQSILITTMLARYFIALSVLYDESATERSDFKLAPKAGISPFFVKEYLAALRLYRPEELDRAILAVTEADLRLKTSSGSKLVVLQEMLAKILQKDA